MSYKMLKNVLQTYYKFLKNFSWMFYISKQISYKHNTTVLHISYLSYKLSMNALQSYHNFLKNVFKRLTNFLQTSYRLFTNFLQT
jgi:hypothetical protein